MKRTYIFLFFAVFLIGCNSEPTLQKYFVEKTEDNKNFVALDISPSILNLDESKLDAEEKKALESFDKMNILAFTSAEDTTLYKAEKDRVKDLLKDEKYQVLMKFGGGGNGGSLSYVGDDSEHIKEFVLYAGQKETGFAVVRILGSDMNPTGVMTLLSLLEKSNVDLAQLKPLQDAFGKK